MTDSDQPEVQPEAEASAEQGGDDKIAALQAELNEANDRVLRAQAELENFRKRSRREFEEMMQFAALPLATDVLTVADNIDLAVQSASQHEGAAGLLEGVKMVATQLQAILEKHGCKRIAALGLPFNPNEHEAIGQQPSEEYDSGNVAMEVRAGFKMHERVLRPTQVFVSTGPPQ